MREYNPEKTTSLGLRVEQFFSKHSGLVLLPVQISGPATATNNHNNDKKESLKRTRVDPNTDYLRSRQGSERKVVGVFGMRDE